VPNASISNDDVAGDHPNNDDTNPTEGLGALRRGEPPHRMATVRTTAATTIVAATTITAATETAAAEAEAATTAE